MIDANAVWLVPGLRHPVFTRYAAFFGKLFRVFQPLDYRAIYLDQGARRLDDELSKLLRARPDLVLYTQFPSTFSHISPERLGELRQGSRVIGLGFDDEMYFEQAKYFYAHCDAVITTDIDDGDWLRSAGIPVYFAQFQQPNDAVKESVVEDIPVSFVGDMRKPGRRDWVHAIESAGIPVLDYGTGSRNGYISHVDMFAVFSRSKVNLNFTRTDPPAWVLRQDPKRAMVGQIKARPFDLAALSKACVCEWARCVEFWFEPRREIAVFTTPEELVAAVKEFVANDRLRREMGAAAHHRYKDQHEPFRQFKRIFLAILGEARRCSTAQTPHYDRAFDESVGRSQAASFAHALARGRPFRAMSEALQRSSRAYWQGFAGGLRDTIVTRLESR